MERLNQNEPEGFSEKKLRINIMRHGPSVYKQPEWTNIQSADDVRIDDTIEEKEMAVRMVVENAEKIAMGISPEEEVVIWASPTGRTLETAKIVSEVLQKKGITVRDVDTLAYGVKMFEKLGEVKNFTWSFFSPLMNGGELSFEGRTFFIDKALSNPKGIGYPEYFINDEIKNIPQEVKDIWPKGYVDKIESFESFVDVTGRMMSALDRLKKLRDKNYRIIIVTHDALTGSIVDTFTSGDKAGINPAQFISLERRGGDLVVTRVGEITEGNDQEDVIDKSKE